MAKSKKTKTPNADSQKRVRSSDYNTDKETVVWAFDNVDNSSRFAFSIERMKKDNTLDIVFGKILSYSTMKWADIKTQGHDSGNKSKNHFLALSSLPAKSIKLITQKADGNEDMVFSFALTNKLRIIGVRDGRIFHVIWYDPEHEFCPSHKR